MKRGREKEALPFSDHQWEPCPCCDKELTQPNTREERSKPEERLESETMRAQPWQFIHGGIWYGVSCDSIRMSGRCKSLDPYLLLIYNNNRTSMAYKSKFFANCQGRSLCKQKWSFSGTGKKKKNSVTEKRASSNVFLCFFKNQVRK